MSLTKRIRGNRIATDRRRRRRAGATLALAVALSTVLAACGGSSQAVGHADPSGGGFYGTLPAAGTPAPGRTLTIGLVKGQAPTYAMPIAPANLASVNTFNSFVNLMDQPLYWVPSGSTPKISSSLSLADPPVYSHGDRTVTITLKRWRWSNGQPVTASDVVFYIDVLRQAIKENASNFWSYTPGLFPDNLAKVTASGQVLRLELTKAYNPGYFTNNQLSLLYALPPEWAISSPDGRRLDYSLPANAKAIYGYLNKQASDVSTFGTNPLWKIADGPMECSAFNPATGSYTLVPNPRYSGPKRAAVSQLHAVVYTSTQAEFEALRAGTLDIGAVDPSDLPSINALRSTYAVYGLPDFGFNAMFINFEDATGHFDAIAKQLYFRQALAHLIDQSGYIRGILKGAGGFGYGPVPASPTSPFAPKHASSAPYPYSIHAARQLLAQHGWHVVPGGQTTCSRAGTGPGDCGPGIPAGSPLRVVLKYANTPPAIGSEVIAFASAAKQVGINIQLKEQTTNAIFQYDSDPGAPADKNQWGLLYYGTYVNYMYPTTENVFNTGGSFNLGGYDNPTANKLIDESVYGRNPAAVTAEAKYLSKDVAALFEPNTDVLWAVKNTVGGTPSSFRSLTQYTWTPQFWYLKK